MTLSDNIQATEMKPIIEFYDIVHGSTVDRFTSYSEDTVFLYHTYVAIPIKRTNLSRDNELSVLQTTITTIPTDLFRLYVASQPLEPVTITIYRAALDDLTSYALLFSGVVNNVQFNGGQVQAVCVADAQYLKQKIPIYLYQAYCNHTLFDGRCAVDKNTYKVSGVLTYVSSTTLKAAIFATKANGYFDQGYVQCGDDKRLIIKHIGDTLTLQAAFDTRAAIGVTVDAYPGCDKSPDTCKNKFSNFDKFLGHPSIPSRSPVTGGFK